LTDKMKRVSLASNVDASTVSRTKTFPHPETLLTLSAVHRTVETKKTPKEQRRSEKWPVDDVDWAVGTCVVRAGYGRDVHRRQGVSDQTLNLRRLCSNPAHLNRSKSIEDIPSHSVHCTDPTGAICPHFQWH
jgi:hypothetical protein